MSHQKHLIIKIVIFSTALLSTLSFSDAALARHYKRVYSVPYNQMYMLQGFYAGLSGGLDVSSLRHSVTTSVTSDSDTIGGFSINNSNNLYYVFPFVGLQLGYRMPFDCLYSMGIEAFGQVNFNEARESGTLTVDSIDATTSAVFKSELEHMYGLRILPGFAPSCNMLVYGILGVGVARFKHELETSSGLLIGPDTLSLASSNKDYTNKASGQIGAGFEFVVTDHIGIGARYIYSYFGNMSTSVPATTAISTGGDTPVTITLSSTGRQSISNHEVALTVNYYM